jgi:hypothetical protein
MYYFVQNMNPYMLKKLFLTLPFSFTIIVFFACNDKPDAPPVQKTGKLNFAFLRYDSAALEYRLDSLQNRGLVLQPITTNAGNNNTAFQLIAYAYDTLGDYNNSWLPDTLRIIKDSAYKTFEKMLLFGNTEISREQLYDVLNDASGKRISFDYMLFTPVDEGIFNHLVYMIQPYKNGHPAANGGKKQITVPIPPGRTW